MNILPDGTLDYEDDLLARARLGRGERAHVVPHGREGDDEADDHRNGAPAGRLIGHPTGRLIDRREPYAIDMEKVIEAAVRTGTFLEINGNPDRRDLTR